MTKKSLFKRILKIFGIVSLGAVVLIGCVIGVMAIRGDFKEKKIEPTEISFEVDGLKVEGENIKLEYDVSASVDENIYSFTVKAFPEDTTELECAVKVSEPSLITFKTKKDGEWVDYNSDVFYLNRPIYFSLNNVTDAELQLEDTITISVEAGYVQTKMALEVERKVTSISFEDQIDAENNQIINGLFAYEYVENDEGEIEAKYDGTQDQKLEAFLNQPYDLKVITAPLKALKPFNSRDAKEYEIYYMDANVPKLLMHDNEVVKLQVFDDKGSVSTQSCDFLTYDLTKNVYVFNSSRSGEYEFRLAVYPTYAKQEELKGDVTLSIGDRLGAMVVKKVILNVTGTDAQSIEFDNGQDNVLMNLLDNNWFILSNPLVEDAQNLGMVLRKGKGTITGRFDELTFLSQDNFRNDLIWRFYLIREEVITDEEGGETKKYTQTNEIVEMNFFNNASGKKCAQVSGISGIPDGTNFDVELKLNGDNKYILTLKGKIEQGEDQIDVSLSLNLVADSKTGGQLSLQTENNLITMRRDDTTDIFLKFNGGNSMILGNKSATDESVYDFQTLKQGLYLVFLGAEENSLYRNINDKFQTEILKNGADTRINIVPKDGAMGKLTKCLYGIVVNSDGSMAYTSSPISVTVNKKTSSIELVKSSVIIPITIKNGVTSYGDEISVESLVKVKDGSYKEVLLFAPKYDYIKLTTRPDDWETASSTYYIYDGETGVYQTANSVEWEAGKFYKKIKNNYRFIDGIYYLNNKTRYYLLGYIGLDGKFVNRVVATGENFDSRLYPFVPQTEFLSEYKRNQTAEEYVDALLTNSMSGVISSTGDATSIRLDTALVSNRKLFVMGGFVQASTKYDANIEYYKVDENGNYVPTAVPSGDQKAWDSKYTEYYIVEPTYLNNMEYVVGATYYTIEDGVYVDATTSARGESDWNSVKGNYYVKADYYLIASVENDGVNDIKITAKLCSSGKLFEHTIEVSIGQDDNNKINITNANEFWDVSKYVTVNNYYDFDNSTLQPKAEFEGSYYEDGKNVNGDKHYIIVDHKDIAMDWNGSTSEGDNAIKNKTANITLTMNSRDVLSNIRGDLRLRAYEYDENNQFLRDNTATISFGEITMQEAVYEQATDLYDKNKTYYTKSGEVYTPVAQVPQNEIDDWANACGNYYVQTSPFGLTAEFWATETLTSKNYIKLVWIYGVGDREFRVSSGVLYIQTREVTQYNINLPSVAYQPILLTADTYAGDFYEFDGEKYVVVTDKTYEKNKYFKLRDYILETVETIDNWETVCTNYYTYSKEDGYQLVTEAGAGYIPNTYYKVDNKKYEGTIAYKILVGYDTDYTYKVYAVDDKGNYLYSKGEGAEQSVYMAIVNNDINNAFGLDGWIKASPFYAINTELEVEGNDCLVVEDNKLVVKQIKTSGSTQVVVKNKRNGLISLSIKTFIGQDGNFTFAPDGYTPRSSSSKLIDIGNGYYKYSTNNIDDRLDIGIYSITIRKNDKDITGSYEYNKEGKTITYTNINDADDYIMVKYENGWKVSRIKFVDVEMSLTFSCIFGSKDCNVKFTNPYTVSRSTTNNTEVIYSGTNFTIAKTSEEVLTDTLYTLLLGENGEGTIVVYVYNKVSSDAEYVRNKYYSYNGTGKYVLVNSASAPKNWSVGDYYEKVQIPTANHLTTYAVPEVESRTEFGFEIEYSSGDSAKEVVDTFALIVEPNVLVMGNPGNIQLDDYNTTYNVANLDIRRFKTGTYVKYEKNDDNLESVVENVTVEFETYTDSKFTKKYSTNVVRFDADDKQIVADVISESGKYYVKGFVKVDKIIAGEIKCEVISKSEIAGENGEIDTLTITARDKEAKKYNLAELQRLFNLKRNGEMYEKTSTYEAGETYALVDGKYELLDAEKSGTTYYRKKYNLTDIFYINYTNPNLQITYNYNGHKLIQNSYVTYIEYNGNFETGKQYYYKVGGNYVLADAKESDVTYYIQSQYNTITYNGIEYIYAGTSFNFGSLTYDMASGKVVGNGEVKMNDLDSNVIRVDNQATELKNQAYYCKQNAMIFKSKDGNLLILSQTNTKRLYILGSSTKVDEPIELKSLESITLEYTAFGKSVKNGVVEEISTGIVDEIKYSIIPVFDIGENGYCINNKEEYTIMVKPFTIQPSPSDIVAGREYKLSDLFRVSGDTVTGIKYEGGENYTLINQSSLKATENGNVGVINVPVTLTYNGGSTYSYQAKLNVLSEYVVEINYMFNVNEAGKSQYEVFNASIEELTNDLKGLAYDLTDLGKWLGDNTSSNNWEQTSRMKFDLLLAGDTIDLNDNSVINRVSGFIRAGNVFDTGAIYYTYDRASQKYKEFSENGGNRPDGFGPTKYFIATTVQIDRIELVAVSSTLANKLQNVKDNVICRDGKITIGEDFNSTGYLAFKVYIKDSTAYGYYIVKVVDDSNFDRTKDTINFRYSSTIQPELKSEMKISDVIKSASTSISNMGRFDASLVADDYSNVYLFMLGAEDNAGNTVKFTESDATITKEIKVGELIDNDLYLQPTINSQIIKLAVVIRCNNTSVVYVGNYEIKLLSKLSISTSKVTTIDKVRNIYEISVKYNYDQTNDSDNTKKMGDLIEVKDAETPVDLSTVEFNQTMTEGIKTNNKITCQDGVVKVDDAEFASISGTNLEITRGTSRMVEFYLTLTYNNGFVAYLKVKVQPIDLKSNNNNIELGKFDGEKFNNILDLSTIFGDYDGKYEIYYSTGSEKFTKYDSLDKSVITDKSGNEVTFASSTQDKDVKIYLKLSNVAPVLETDVYNIKCFANINTVWESTSGYDERVMVSKATGVVTNVGSKLTAKLENKSGVSILTIKNGETIILTTSFAEYTEITFDMGNADANKYFASELAGNKLAISSTGEHDIPFIHLPSEKDLTLTITIMNGATQYSGIGIRITLPKTYELKTSYRVSDYVKLETAPADWNTSYNNYYYKDSKYIRVNEIEVPDFNAKEYYKRVNANHETVIENTSLNLTKVGAENNIGFFAGFENSDSYNEINSGRLYVVVNGVDYDFKDVYNNIGLLSEGNPNNLNTKMVESTLASGGASLQSNNTILNFGNSGDEVTLTINNDVGASISYVFEVYTEETDLGKFTFADLLVVEENNQCKVPVSSYDLNTIDVAGNAEKVNTEFTLGYLRYYPNDNGNFAWVKTNNVKVSFRIESNPSGGVNVGAIKLSTYSKDLIYVEQDITITIITLNGVAKKLHLLVNPINVDYGYTGEYEQMYAGTEGYKLTDNTSIGKPRISFVSGRFDQCIYDIDISTWESKYQIYYTYNTTTRCFVKNDTTSIPTYEAYKYYWADEVDFATNTNFTYEYKGSVNGLISYLPYGADMDYPADDTSVIRWNDNKTFATRAVNYPMDLTLIFDVKKNDQVVARIYYRVHLINNINIGVNKKLDETQTLNLYLGSEIYANDGIEETTINLLESRNGANYNNIFVTLEQYPNYIILDNNGNYVGNALYNGSSDKDDKTQSVYEEENVGQYLRFSVNNFSEGLDGLVTVGEYDGKLSIKGNPSGTFTLNVYSTNGTGYGKSFDIIVHPYYKVTAKYNDSIAVDLGNKKSGETVSLVNAKQQVDSNWAFNIQRLGNGSLEGTEKLMEVPDKSSSIKIESTICGASTPIEEIKNSTAWTVENINFKDGRVEYTIPAVPYSTSSNDISYYIVAIRLKLIYNGSTSVYYAHYRVYNNAYIEVSEYYINNGKTVTYGEGCWESGDTITLMSANNIGMYNSLVVLTDEPNDWGEYKNYYQYKYTQHTEDIKAADIGNKIYYLKDAYKNYNVAKEEDLARMVSAGKIDCSKYEIYERESTYINVEEDAKFVAGQYFKLNDVISQLNDGNVSMEVRSATNETIIINSISVDGADVKLTIHAGQVLFTNSGAVTIIFKDQTNRELLRDEWTFKSNVEITPQSTKPLSDFFLLSEIGNQNYYNTKLIGMCSTEANISTTWVFANGAELEVTSKVSVYDDITVNGAKPYHIYKVTYKTTGATGSTIFTTTYDAYVLVGATSLMQINFNGGNYYINHVVDDKAIQNNTAEVDVANYVIMWGMKNGKFAEVGKTNLKVNEGQTSITLEDVDTYTSGKSVPIKITCAGVTRNVELYFNIIITAKKLDGNLMSNNAKLTSAIGEKKTLENDDIDSNAELKAELLQLIKFNGMNVTGATSTKFKIKVTRNADKYELVYIYDDSVVSYTRTLYMSL